MTHTIPAGDQAPQKQRARKVGSAARTRPAGRAATRQLPAAARDQADQLPAPAVRVRAGSPSAVLAIIPHLLGFAPEASMVIIGTEAQKGAVRVTLRYDLPDPSDQDLAADIAEHAAAVLAAQQLTVAIVVGYGPDELVRPLAMALGGGMSRAGIAVPECLRVDGGRYWSYTCGDEQCCPDQGKPYDRTGHPVSAVMSAAGEPVLGGRSAVADTLAPVAGAAAESMRQATRRAERHVTQIIAKVRKSIRIGAARHMLAGEGLAAVASLIATYRAGGQYSNDYQIAWLTVALKDLRVRDDAWARMDPKDRDAHRRLWTDVVRRAQPGYVAAPASLLAFVAWQDGNGALANIALDRALKDAPGYSMATLLRQVITAGAPPSMARLPLTPDEVAACYDGIDADLDVDDLDDEDPDDELCEVDGDDADKCGDNDQGDRSGCRRLVNDQHAAGDQEELARIKCAKHGEENRVPATAAEAPGAIEAHEAAVATLRDAYAALPQGVPVRLAKRTSNLFRFRDGESDSQGLDVSAFSHVLSVDPATRTAKVGGMTTYEDLCDATLRHRLMPLVVPQLKTITLGGAVTGLGIESTSLRSGMPHESVTEMEILTGDGRVVIATEGNEHHDLFRGFPNSYGTLGYSLSLTIELEPVKPYVHIRHFRFTTPEACMDAVAEIAKEGSYQGHKADFTDGTAFSPQELYLTVGSFSDVAPWRSDYSGQQIYYQSIRRENEDFLTILDYLWRWDPDWFWCSKPFGVQKPMVRRLWPRRYRRSDVYRKVVAFDRRHHLSDTINERRHLPRREAVIQDVEIPVERGAEFLRYFADKVRMSPVWMCPLRLRGDRSWPLYPLQPGEVYVNFGFWGTVPLPDGRQDGYYNRLVEDEVAALGGHKSLYSTSFYSEDEFYRRYNGDAYKALKHAYDGDGRLLGLYEKCVRGR